MKKKEAKMPAEHHEHASDKLEERLLHNLVELQKVHVDLAQKFDKLSEQITSLLRLFESAAHAFAKQENLPNVEKDREFLDKIDRLLDQNKTIAKGLMLMEEKMRERVYGAPSSHTQLQQRSPPSGAPRPLPRF